MVGQEVSNERFLGEAGVAMTLIAVIDAPLHRKAHPDIHIRYDVSRDEQQRTPRVRVLPEAGVMSCMVAHVPPNGKKSRLPVLEIKPPQAGEGASTV